MIAHRGGFNADAVVDLDVRREGIVALVVGGGDGGVRAGGGKGTGDVVVTTGKDQRVGMDPVERIDQCRKIRRGLRGEKAGLGIREMEQLQRECRSGQRPLEQARRADLRRAVRSGEGTIDASLAERGERDHVRRLRIVEGAERRAGRCNAKGDVGDADIVGVVEVHRVTAGAQPDAAPSIGPDLERGRRVGAEPVREKRWLGGAEHAGFDEDDGFPRCDAGDAGQGKCGRGGLGAVIDFPAGDVHGTRADVGDFEPIGSDGAVTAAPWSHFGDAKDAGCGVAGGADLDGAGGGGERAVDSCHAELGDRDAV